MVKVAELISPKWDEQVMDNKKSEIIKAEIEQAIRSATNLETFQTDIDLAIEKIIDIIKKHEAGS